MKFIKHRINHYLQYFARAQTIYDIHSPFLYDFLSFTADQSRLYYQFQELDGLRLGLLSDYSIIDDGDPGAGSTINRDMLCVQDVAKTAMSSQQKCEWLYRLMLFLQPKSVLELGASLGIAALYMGAPIGQSNVFSIEGRPSIAKIARKTIKKSSIDNVHLVEGLFDDVLNDVLDKNGPFDFIVLDGNHLFEPTIRYANLILKHHQPTAMLVDDIYWSPEMTKAWQVLKKINRFNVSIDFYDYGLLLFRPEIKEPIELSYITYYKKFWRMGFF